MGNPIKLPAMLDMLLAKDKGWDFCVIYIKGKNPVAIESDVKLVLNAPGILVMESLVPHPAPQSQADVKKQFVMLSYFETSEVYAIDFYKEKLIQEAPGGKLIQV